MRFWFISYDTGHPTGSGESFCLLISVPITLSVLVCVHASVTSSSKRSTLSCFLALSAAVQQDIFQPSWL